MKITSLDNKSSVIWALLFLLLVYLVFSWDTRIAKHTHDYSVMLEESRAQFKEGNYFEALRLAEKLQLQFPNNPYHMQYLIELYDKVGDEKQRERTLRKLISAAPAIVVQEVGPSLLKSYELSLLQKCLARLPEDPDTLLKLSFAEILENDLVSAEKHLYEAVRLAPKYPDIYIALGKLAEKKHDRTLALKYYQKALELRPQDTEIQEVLDGLLGGTQ